MKVELDDLQKVLVEVIEAYRAKMNGSKRKVPLYDGAIVALSKVLIWVSDQNKQDEEVADVEKLKRELKAELVSIDDIPGRELESPIKNQIIEWVNQLQEANKGRKSTDPAPALKIVSGINYNTLGNRVSQFKKQNVIPQNVVVVSRNEGKDVWLTLK